MRRFLAISLLGALSLALIGCQAAPFSEPGPHRPRPELASHNSSLVFAPAGSVINPSIFEEPYLHWYEYRNDARLTAFDGYLTPAEESSYTYTFDQQNFYRGRVNNSYSSSSYRLQIQAGSR